MIQPYFSSNYSIGRSLFTLEPPEEIKNNSPVSLFSVAKQEKLDKIVLVDSSMTGFIKAHLEAQKQNIQLMYGIKFIVCHDINDKSDESRKTESKLIVFMKNSAAYSEMCRLYSKSWVDGKYYTNRLDWKYLNETKSANFSYAVPFYDGFIHLNTYGNGQSVPDIAKLEPTFFTEEHELPIDNLLRKSVLKYTEQNKYATVEMHRTLYLNNDDFLALQVLRLATGRGGSTDKPSIDKPNIDGYASNKFSWQYYKETKL